MIDSQVNLRGQLRLALADEETGQYFALQLALAELLGTFFAYLAKTDCVDPYQLSVPEKSGAACMFTSHPLVDSLTEEDLLEDIEVL